MQAATGVTSPAARQYSAERRYPRFLLSAPVSTRRFRGSRSRITKGITLDISMGGVSAMLCGPPPVGQLVALRVDLPETSLQANAVVRHSNPSRTGFEFVKLSRESQNRIEHCIQRSLLSSWPKAAEFHFIRI
jgi:hypothetical protein